MTFILSERTPNPDAMRFSAGSDWLSGPARTFCRPDFQSRESPLAARLFEVAGVAQVYVAAAFLTITRQAEGPGWDELRPQVLPAIADHLASGEPAVEPEATATAAPDASDQIEIEIRDVLARHVRPGVARDGGDILFGRFEPDTGVLFIRMQGACGGCPSSRLTLKAGVETIMRRYVPEVVSVQDVGDESGDLPSSRRRWLALFHGRQVGGNHHVTFARRSEPSP